MDTKADEEDLDLKVDKVAGKGLSTEDFTTQEKNKLASIGAVMTYRGSVTAYANLPSTGNVTGDTYNVSSDGKNYCWNGTGWDDLGGTIDLSSYVQKTELVPITNSQIQSDWDNS
ncbi:MAG: hypothetical protein KBS82_05680 [Oscillospiraceae bacterium]|nr:hypothetical protein [Candidatus Limimonas egerieequi]